MENLKKKIQFFYFLPESNNNFFLVEEMVEKPRNISIARQMKCWTGKALETVNCCAFLKRRLIGAC
jgi:hypothetical protein